MNRFLLPLGLFAALAVVLVIGIRHSPDKGIITSPLLGKAAPEFSLPALKQDGGMVSSHDLRGRWFLLNVWGTWCYACRDEHAMLLKAHAAGVLPVIGLDWKDDDAKARAWLAQAGDPYDAIAVDRSGRAAIDWGVYGAPETFLVNPAGVVVFKHVGALDEETWSREILPRVQGVAGKS